jgi:hypothetical protein
MSQRFSLRFVRKPVPENVKCVNCVNQTKLRRFMMNHDNVTASRYIYILHYVFMCLHTIYIYESTQCVCICNAYVYMVYLDICVHCNDLTVMPPEKIFFFSGQLHQNGQVSELLLSINVNHMGKQMGDCCSRCMWDD